MLRDSLQAKYYVAKLTKKYSKGKALGIYWHFHANAGIFVLPVIKKGLLSMVNFDEWYPSG